MDQVMKRKKNLDLLERKKNKIDIRMHIENKYDKNAVKTKKWI